MWGQPPSAVRRAQLGRFSAVSQKLAAFFYVGRAPSPAGWRPTLQFSATFSVRNQSNDP